MRQYGRDEWTVGGRVAAASMLVVAAVLVAVIVLVPKVRSEEGRFQSPGHLSLFEATAPSLTIIDPGHCYGINGCGQKGAPLTVISRDDAVCQTESCWRIDEAPKPYIYTASQEAMRLSACTNQFPDLPAIAERLGVPASQGLAGAIVLTTCDGRNYDFIALINALLDRMDKAGK